MTKRRGQRSEKDPLPAPRAPAERFAQWDQLLLGGAVALVVATPLVPSEATVSAGAGAPLHVLWLVLLCLWAAIQALRPERRAIFGWTAVAAAALIALHTLSALVVGTQGNARQALNMLWQFVSYAALAFLLRQLVTTSLACRAIVAVMIALCVAEAAHGYYEYFIGQPAQRAAFEKDPEATYRQMGLTAQSQRELFRWRIESREPLGTFALTNSLAGLLAPWLIVALGAAAMSVVSGRKEARSVSEGQSIPSRDTLSLLLTAAFIAGCLLLTKSRTAILACGGGLVLLALYGRNWRWRIDPRVLAGIGGGMVALALTAITIGGLDVQVLSEAPTSVLYRLQYWQSTARMIADHPLLGSGPGQFQEYFARYKLPQASETPADPHNFLLELWATAGTPALIAALAMGGAFAWQIGAGMGRGKATAQGTVVGSGVFGGNRLAFRERSFPPKAADPLADASRSPSMPVYLGALTGVLAAYPLAASVNYPQQTILLLGDIAVPTIWLVGLPAATLAVWLLDGWVRHGTLPTASLVIGLVVLLVNLLAAGAVSFPGVFMSMWLLMVLALANSQAPFWECNIPRGLALALLLASAALALTCMHTELSPALLSPLRQQLADELLAAGKTAQAEAELLSAAAADPWSPAPWEGLARLRLQRWISSGDERDRLAFRQAADRARDLNPHHHATWTSRGHWFLLAWRKSGRPADLSDAVAAYRQALLWYPGRALPHAQLAVALHLAGEAEQADAEFDEALRLDRLLPHAEQKLARQTLYFPIRQANGSIELDPASAEQLIARLRTTSESP